MQLQFSANIDIYPNIFNFIIASTIIEMVCNDLKFHDMQNDTEYLLLKSVLKEQKKIQQRQEKGLVKVKNNKLGFMKKENPNKKSKFKEKYEDRVHSIQNTDAKIQENKKIAKQIEKIEKMKKSSAESEYEETPRREPIRRTGKKK